MSERGEETSGDPRSANLPTAEIRERMNGISAAANIAAIQGVELPPEVTDEYAALAAELERRLALRLDEE